MLYKDLFKGKVILITGGTGFLGQEIVKRLLPYEPKSIRLFSRDEVKHFQVNNKFNNILLRNLIGDVRDYSRLRKALNGVDIVIHAAALKRIDILEYNVEESIQTNVFGTLNVARASWDENVEKVIFISTDKACSPVNTYGACKFIGERIFAGFNYNRGNSRTIFTIVRYGNVLDSTGSVIPCFINNIKQNQPLPLTDDEMTRFFITPDQAVDLIFKAIKYGVGGEVFIPHLKSFKVKDLISTLVEHYNKNPGINIVGIRPGEKIHEILLNDVESRRTYQFQDLFIIKSEIERSNSNPLYECLKESKFINFDELSSKDFLVNKEELSLLLKKNNLVGTP